MGTFTPSLTIQAVQAWERLPTHKVESQTTADPSAKGHPVLQDNPRQAPAHLLCHRSICCLRGRPQPHASLWCCKVTTQHLFLWRLLCNDANKNSGPKHTGATSALDPSSGRILYIPLFLQGRTGLGRTSHPTDQSKCTQEGQSTASRLQKMDAAMATLFQRCQNPDRK